MSARSDEAERRIRKMRIKASILREEAEEIRSEKNPDDGEFRNEMRERFAIHWNVHANDLDEAADYIAELMGV